MFDSLEERMKHDDAIEIPRNERLVKYAVVTLLSTLVFVALYMGLMLIEG